MSVIYHGDGYSGIFNWDNLEMSEFQDANSLIINEANRRVSCQRKYFTNEQSLNCNA